MFRKNKLIICIILIVILFSNTSIFCSDSIYVWSSQSDSIVTNSNVNEDIKSMNPLNLESGSAILIEQNSGKILYEHNIHEKLRPASVTKVMTILLIMESLDNGKINLEDKVPCSENASSMGGSQIWLDVKEELTVNEMLKAICVVSANDCTVAMAEFLAGSEEAFVRQMNEKAKELGMNDTTFKNCHGIDEDGHVTSSYDISLMSRELLLKHPNILNYTTIYMDSLRDGKSELVNTNKLIKTYSGSTGLKTGSTSLALYNLSASATRDNLSLIAVIMKAPNTKTRFNEARKLLDYGFTNYTYKEFCKKNDKLKTIHIEKSITDSINGIASEPAGTIIKKGNESNVIQELNLYDNISAPIQAGEKIGEISFKLNNDIISTVDIISDSNADKITLWNMTTYLYDYWFKLLR